MPLPDIGWPPLQTVTGQSAKNAGLLCTTRLASTSDSLVVSRYRPGEQLLATVLPTAQMRRPMMPMPSPMVASMRLLRSVIWSPKALMPWPHGGRLWGGLKSAFFQRALVLRMRLPSITTW